MQAKAVLQMPTPDNFLKTYTKIDQYGISTSRIDHPD
jgi:hypothetical protein